MIKVRRSGGRIMPDEQAVEREGGRGIFILRVVVFIALIAFLVMYFIEAAWIDAFSFYLTNWQRWLGFALGVASVVFWTWTQFTLDIQWSAQLQLTKRHRLITSGPYARIRHPLYTSMIGWCVAISMLTANWLFVSVSVLCIAALFRRVPLEEKMMIESFGDEYKAYMQRTGRFFPKL